jgi:hypothetical protein
MTVDYSVVGKVSIGMADYVDNMLTGLPYDMNRESATSASNHLFQVCPNSNAKKLSPKQSIFFHHNTAKLLFLCKRTWPDIQTATVFLYTRVKSPDKDE